MPQIIKKDNYVKTILSLIIPILCVVFKPMGMTASQSMILGGLFLTIVWWGTGWVYKDYASFFLLIVFIMFGNTPLKNVLFFPLSDSFILVVASYILSQGISNSKVADKFSSFILSRYCDNSKKLVIMSFVLGVILIFVIPQPFPRVILLASIYFNFLNKSEVDSEEKQVLIFSIFVASTVTSMMFLNGDVIINYAAMKFGGITFTNAEWAKYMTVPTIITTIIIAATFIFVFKDSLNDKFKKVEKEKLSFNKDGKMALMITGLIILLWLTETHHSISSANVALIGVILMFVTKIVSFKDIKVVNVSLLIFLTAEFSIGKVLTGSGVAQHLGQFLTGFFPSSESIFYIPFIVLFIMVLHSIMGSLVTAVSVLIPMLITITAGVLSPQFIVLLTLVSVCIHYILPFQHVSIMIGYGNGYYENRHIIKFGLVLTIITFITSLLVYIPWWKFTGLI